MASARTLGAHDSGRRSRRLPTVLAATIVLVLIAALSTLSTPDRLASAADVCLGSSSPAALSTMFDSEPGGIIAADDQRAVPLPDGRTLWLFQDATIRLPPPTPPTVPPLPGEPFPPREQLLHNIGMLQTGSCFTVLRSGTAQDPKEWLLADQTTTYGHWFWPLGAEMGSDGRLYVYLAEMFERGALYLSATDPVRTRIVGINLASMRPTFAGIPPGSSSQLYGFSVTSDRSWTYLYGHCHRQFGWDPGPFVVPAHDLGCAGNVPVARVPKGQLFNTPTYWDGTSWQGDPNRAVSVMPRAGRSINPSQVRFTDGEFLAVTKVGDWFGSTIYLDRAPAAHGPWSNYARIPAPPKCSTSVCNTYFASWVPGTVAGDHVIGLSHNRWDGRVTAINRPTYLLAPDAGSHAFALRCAIVDC
jgi:hypothetical protein